jgi:hypothetical protein
MRRCLVVRGSTCAQSCTACQQWQPRGPRPLPSVWLLLLLAAPSSCGTAANTGVRPLPCAGTLLRGCRRHAVARAPSVGAMYSHSGGGRIGVLFRVPMRTRTRRTTTSAQTTSSTLTSDRRLCCRGSRWWRAAWMGTGRRCEGMPRERRSSSTYRDGTRSCTGCWSGRS